MSRKRKSVSVNESIFPLAIRQAPLTLILKLWLSDEAAAFAAAMAARHGHENKFDYLSALLDAALREAMAREGWKRAGDLDDGIAL